MDGSTFFISLTNNLEPGFQTAVVPDTYFREKLMRKVRFTLSALVMTTIVAFSSCTSLTYSERTVKTVDPQSSAHIMPVVTDLNVSNQKSTTTCTFTEKLSQTDVAMGPNSRKVKELKAEALTEAAKKLNCDVIVAPVYEVTATDHQTVEVKVTGFPATYTGFRKASSDDIELLLKNDSLLLVSGGGLASDWQYTKILTRTSFSRGPGFDIRLGVGLFPSASLGFEYYLSNKFSFGLEAGLFNGIEDDFLDFDQFGGAFDGRYYFSEKPFSFFVDLKLGMHGYRKWSYDDDDYKTSLNFFVAPSVGVSYRYLDINAGVAYGFGYEEVIPTIGINYNLQLKKK